MNIAKILNKVRNQVTLEFSLNKYRLKFLDKTKCFYSIRTQEDYNKRVVKLSTLEHCQEVAKRAQIDVNRLLKDLGIDNEHGEEIKEEPTYTIKWGQTN